MNRSLRIRSLAQASISAILAILLCSCSTSALPPDSEYPFRVPEGWKIRLFADYPELSNAVAFCLDEQGRIYVAEEHRFNRGTEENRTRPFLLEDDLQLNTVEDRLAMYRKWSSKFEGGMSWFEKYSDQVRRLEDRDGDGRSDRSTIFAGGFNRPLDGLAAGIIAREGEIFFTCIPHLWKLLDKDGDGIAESREIVHSGFGVNAGFLGHDLHGLTWGPDGKLYFSVGDRGFHVTTREGKLLHGPRRGGIFRCDADGSNLELVSQGLRNPQELAFDHYGNLFAADNNCDKGDDSRLVYIIEGGDSGWNMAYQTIPTPYLTGPWHAEKLWHLPHAGQAAYIVPPVAKLGAGPSGFAAYPGIGLPERYRNHLFYCNFTSDGGVESFSLRDKGAGFEIEDFHKVITPINATDVDFGYDGRIYFSDYGKLAWDGSNEGGRIFSLEAPEASEPRVAETKTLFHEGFKHRTDDQLIKLLGHPDQRVRQRAQFRLAERGTKVVPELVYIARNSNDRFARLHAIWALGQISRKDADSILDIISLMRDSDSMIRSNIARVVGEAAYTKGRDGLVERLNDIDDHVKLAAAIALGKLGDRTTLGALIDFLRKNKDQDPFLRHAGVMGLIGAGGEGVSDLLLKMYARDPSKAVRMAVVLVCRRESNPKIATFLQDQELSIVTEAARAINDIPIDAATEPLAKVLSHLNTNPAPDLDPLIRRAINANFRLGRPENIQAIVEYATDRRQPGPMREEALSALVDWTSPSQRDRVNWFWRPLVRTEEASFRSTITTNIPGLLAETHGRLQALAIEAIDRSGAEIDGSAFRDRVRNQTLDPSIRLAALRLLGNRKATELTEAIEDSLQSNDANLRAEALQIQASVNPQTAFIRLTATLRDAASPVTEKQRALETIATLKSSSADTLLREYLEKFIDPRKPSEIDLDIIEAASRRNATEVREALDKYKKANTDSMNTYRASLLGGESQRGAKVFTDHALAQCIRCHRVAGVGGTTGPDLTVLSARTDRETILKSLVDPDAVIAPGFGTAHLRFAMEEFSRE